ncbi:MAG: hypothetical protein JXM68_11620, partial [Sedimentisphaerales bacterium]|nr:hypothetical protein [Sedimentisphaerales bacterium]
AAQQVIGEQMAGGAEAGQVTGMGYAVAYPFGIMGIILVMVLLRLIFKISVNTESAKYKKELIGINGKLDAVNIRITNLNLIGKSVAFIRSTLDGRFVISRLWRNNQFLSPADDEVIQQGDMLYGVSSREHYNELSLTVGNVSETVDLGITGELGMKHVMVTNKSISGKTLKEIGISRRFPASITRIFRGDTEILPAEDNTLEFGDTIRIVGQRKVLGDVSAMLGNSVEQLSHPNVLPILLGVFLGIVVGSIPIAIPGLPAPAKLGLAGGPLLVALLLGHKGRIGHFSFYMTRSSNLYIRELGIILFLACVGLSSGRHFISTIMEGGYMWMVYGALITFLPLMIVALIARFLKINYLTICGFLAGSMTDPPALEFANALTPGQAQSTAYATVYPLTMFLRVLLAQVLVLMLL